MKTVFRGRETELKILERKYRQDDFVMTVLYGRRRIGKTANCFSFYAAHW